MTLAHDSADHAWMRQLEDESETVIGFRTAWGKHGPRYIAYAVIDVDGFNQEVEGWSRSNWMEALDHLAIEMGARTPEQIEALQAEREAAAERHIADAVRKEVA